MAVRTALAGQRIEARRGKGEEEEGIGALKAIDAA
jgi:hypothetical protein